MKTKLYCPYTVELLFDFFGEFGIKTNEVYTPQKKKKVLSQISEMLDKEIIYITERKNNKFIKWNYSNDEIIKQIDRLWTKKLEFYDFYEMIWFGYQKWYIDKLNNLGFEEAENWDKFIDQKIGDLEQWIENNRPKKILPTTMYKNNKGLIS